MKRCFTAFIFLLGACQTKAPVIEENPSREVSSVITRGQYFEDVTATSGVSETPASSIIVGDFDNDGWVDFMAAGRLYKNISTLDKIQFIDVTERVRLQNLVGYPVFIDVDNDGRLDIVTTKGQLFHQRTDGTFEDLSRQYDLGFPDNVKSISYGDLNGDGYADLILGMGDSEINGRVTLFPQQMRLNVRGKKFVKYTAAVDFSSLTAYTRGMPWADYNNDGSPDIYFSNYRLHRNYLFEIKKGRVIDTAIPKGVAGDKDSNRYYDPVKKEHYGPTYGHTIGSVWADFNNDGLLDLWVSNLAHKFVGRDAAKGAYDIRGYLCDDSKIYKNLGAPDFKFVDMRAKSGIPLKPIGDYSKYKGDELWSHSTAADFDNDGLIDMYVTQVYDLKYAYSFIFKNSGNFTFSEISQSEPTRVLDSYAGVWADFNNDGKMDLINSGRPSLHADKKLYIYKNISQNDNNFLKIRLIGTKSGKNPVTTQVRLFHKEGVFLRQVDGVIGTMNQQNDPVLHFGLGRVSEIEKIEIRWNSGKVQTLKTPRPNQTLTVTEE
ncbi:MAG: CRTAC1 family protein [Bdellovibrionales bacterium]|nr:CRTAC1 family protein [Bdellovibrionales bacterium]